MNEFIICLALIINNFPVSIAWTIMDVHVKAGTQTPSYSFSSKYISKDLQHLRLGQRNEVKQTKNRPPVYILLDYLLCISKFH